MLLINKLEIWCGTLVDIWILIYNFAFKIICYKVGQHVGTKS